MMSVATAQTCLVPPTYSPAGPYGTWKWARQADVTVTIDTAFTSNERIAIKEGFEEWNNNRIVNCSLVTFSGFQQGPRPATSVNGVVFVQYDDALTSGGNASMSTGVVTQALINIGRFLRHGVEEKYRAGYLKAIVAHEVGHTLYLDNTSSSGTIMQTPADYYGNRSVTTCDSSVVSSVYCPPTPSPTPPPQNPEECQATGWYWNYNGSYCQSEQWFCETEPDCPFNWTWSYLTCQCTTTYSPILIDVRGDGFDLTDNADGVDFDIDGDGVRQRLSWTAATADDAWLALDRDGDGAITKGAELFGNFTAQPAPPPPGEELQGFLALAEFDKAASGGDGDGKISRLDAIFDSVRLWQDANHDGVSQPGELKTLKGLGLKSIGLDYKKSKRVDEHGNEFRYRAKVADENNAQLGRWAWDVFLVSGR